MASERRAGKLLERLEGCAFDLCEILEDLETSKGVEILLDHLRWHFEPIDVSRQGRVADDFVGDFERQPDEEVDVLEAKEANDDELEAKHQEAAAMMTITEPRKEEVDRTPLVKPGLATYHQQ